VINVLVAEDEPPTLRRVAAMVEQTDALFRVVGSALNGREALRVMETVHVDVLLTDIRMPVMDGARLMEEVSARYPDCVVVVLSGFQDYDYMARAIRARSLDYLLKPVSTETMRGLLARVKARYLSMSRERLSNSLAAHISGASPGASARTADGARLGVCLFCAGGMPFGDDAEMFPGADAWSSVSLETLAEQAAPGFAAFKWEFMGSTPVERIMFFQTGEERFEPWLERLHELVVDRTDVPVSCAYVSEAIPLSGVNASVRLLRGELGRRMRVGHSMFMCVKPSGAASGAADCPEPDDSALSAKLADLLSSGKIGTASPFRRELFHIMESEGWTQRRVARLFIEAAAALEKHPDKAVRRASRQYRGVMVEAASTSPSLKALEEALAALPPPLEEILPGGAKNPDVADDIAKYLRERYTDSITNQTLAKTFGYVPSYISVLFRRKYKMSPSEYLSMTRMDEAKRLMRENPGILVKEVSDRVGFKNQHHFSRAFKKMEGMRPTSYLS
jgi:DNA-binding NarL/FixJ family response regulator/AraC-like DNA-binding protein